MLQDELESPAVHVVAVFAPRSFKPSVEELHTVMHQYLEYVGVVPTLIMLPSDGPAGLAEWAESIHVRVRVHYSAWVKKGKIAQVLRDEEMRRECTHALLFTELADAASALRKMGKRVIYAIPSDGVWEITETLASAPPSAPASRRARKSGTKTVPMLPKCQTTEGCSAEPQPACQPSSSKS